MRFSSRATVFRAVFLIVEVEDEEEEGVQNGEAVKVEDEEE